MYAYVLAASCLGSLTFSLVAAVDKVYLLAVGAHNERGTVRELHGGRLRIVEGRPVRQALVVRIAGLGKVYPVLLDDFGHGTLSGIFVALQQEVTIQVHDIVGMGHTTTAWILRETHG